MFVFFFGLVVWCVGIFGKGVLQEGLFVGIDFCQQEFIEVVVVEIEFFMGQVGWIVFFVFYDIEFMVYEVFVDVVVFQVVVENVVGVVVLL